jgi:hypothetical protein
MRCDPKPVAWGKLFAGRQVGVAERVFSDDLAAMRDSDDQPGCCEARTWNSIQLRIYPIADCTHGSICAPKCQLVLAIYNALKNSAGIFLDATGQNKTGATFMVAPADLAAAEL